MKRMAKIFLCALLIFYSITPLPKVLATNHLDVKFYNGITNSKTSTISLHFKLINQGTEKINLSHVKMNYFFTNDGTQKSNFHCDYSQIDSTKITAAFHDVSGVNTDRCLEIGFQDDVGVLAPGNSIEIHGRIWKSDWSNFTQNNDYSFDETISSFSNRNSITAYLDNELISGMSPVEGTSTPPSTTQQSENIDSLVPILNISQKSVPENSAMTFVKDMRIGWNLGNTFDAYGASWITNELEYESTWCGTITTKKHIDILKEKGIQTIRIPVSWHDHVSGNDYKINEKWLNRVQEVVDYCIGNNMHVILNIHHDIDKNYYFPSSNYIENSTKYMSSIWKQLSNRFGSYDEHLIFESINEPRLVGHTNEWWIDPNNQDVKDAILCINKLNQVFVDTVRASGGKNETRYLMCPGYDASPDGATNPNFKLPTDLKTNNNKIIVSVHAYTPYNFALESPGTDFFSVTDTTSVNNLTGFMDNLYSQYTSKGIPVVIGEFGARNKNNLKARVEYAAYYIAAAKARGITCLWWDNNAFTGEGELFGLMNRNTYEIQYPEILQGMIKYAGEKTPSSDSTEKENSSKVQFIGRFDTSDSKGPKFAWSNSTIKANFKGTGIAVDLRSTGDNWFQVILDQVDKGSIFVPASTSKSMVLASNLKSENHTIELIKRTEASVGEAQFLGFQVTDGTLLDPPTPSKRRILFIGDSITAGYGNEGTNQYETFTSKNENAYLTYGALTARSLNADIMNISWSGIGLTRNYGGNTENLMPARYQQILPSNSTQLWDAAKWTPQVVLINLGTNDYSIGTPDKTLFTKTYSTFIDNIRAQYPNGDIYCTIGPMLNENQLSTARDYIKNIVTQKNSSGDSKIHFMEFPMQNSSNGYGEDWHPSLKTHEIMARQLIKQLQTDLEW